MVIVLKEGEEILIENAVYEINLNTERVSIFDRKTKGLIASFNFANIAGVRSV